LQDPESFSDGVMQITEAQQRVALRYMDDGGYEAACPPLRAVLSIMAYGDYEGKGIEAAEVRNMFTRAALLDSDWYQRRLAEKKRRDVEHWQKFDRTLRSVLTEETEADVVQQLNLQARLQYVADQLKIAQHPDYEKSLVGTLGVDPMQPSPYDEAMVNRLANA
jgi:hypothetical protein